MQKSEIKFLDLLEKDIYNRSKVKIPQSVLVRIADIKNKAKIAKTRNEEK